MPDERDLLQQISSRFGELQNELERTRGELDIANKKLHSYVGFEDGLREAVAAALAKTQDEMLPRLAAIREDLSQAEMQRDALQAEVERLRNERQELEAAVAALRPASSQLQRASADTLRSLFHQVLAEMRDELVQIAAPSSPVPSPAAPAAVAHDVTPEPAPVAPPTAEPASVAPEPPRPANVAHEAAPVRRYDEGLIEDVDELAPSAPTAAATAPSHIAVADELRQIELVVKAVRSFPQLIAIENRIQSMPGVSRVYMHRAAADGTATLTVQLDNETGRDDFVATLEKNDRPQLLIEAITGDQVQVRIAP